MEITISGKSISYDVIGSGSPILFVHGWGGDKEALRRLAQSLEDRHECYLIDLPGFGESENPPLDWGVEGYASAVRKFILELNISPVGYVGHSFGGAVGVYLSATEKDLIGKLVLISASYRRPVTRAFKQLDISAVKRLLTPVRRLAYKIFYPGSVALKFAHLESNFRRIVSTDLSDLLGQIGSETLVLWPADDIETPLNDAYVLRDSIKNSHLEIIGSTGHDLPINYVELIEDKVRRFLG